MAVPLDREIKILWNGITRTTVQSINGEFEGNFKLPYDTMVGNHSLTAKVDDQNYLRESSDKVEVFVQRETEIIIQWLVDRNQSTTVSGYLRDAAGMGLSNLNLDFYFDGAYVGNITTQNLGLFSFEYLIPFDTALGSHNIVRVDFTGSHFYVESSNNAKSEILSTTIFEFNKIEVFRDQEFFLRSYLFDDLANPMPNQHVNLTFDGVRYHLVTDAAGLIEQNISLTPNHKLGNYALNGIIWDSNSIFRFHLSKKFELWLRLTLPYSQTQR